MTARATLLRVLGMLIGGIALLVLGGATVSLESRLWMAPTMLGVVLLFRVAYDLYELDGWLSLSTVTALAFSGMAIAAFRNLSERTGESISHDEGVPLETRTMLFLAIGAIALVVAAWRAYRALQAER